MFTYMKEAFQSLAVKNELDYANESSSGCSDDTKVAKVIYYKNARSLMLRRGSWIMSTRGLCITTPVLIKLMGSD